ncbi:GNAT family N-acetyltransferase [Roseovarius sp. 2305UL8-3]|uniref:GNAT family N-acetyltransferase n=1 Tax=Roseovarius conchicola TaxID=3121636 RepID=UPI0035272541
MTVELRQGDVDAFFQVPFEVYRGQPYVSPLKSDLRRFLCAKDNPLFERADDIAVFTCHRTGRPVGRITAHVHCASNTRHGQNAAHFGFFDCADDGEVARTLLDAAEAWARARGFDRIGGNFNLTAMQMVGVATGGFEHQVYSDCMWSPPWLAGLLEANGYKRRFPMATHETDLNVWQAQAGSPRSLPDGVSVALLTRATLGARLEDARQILNASFDANPMFVPVSQEEYMFQAKDLKWIMDKRLSVVLHASGRPVGVLIGIPDLNPLLRRMRGRLGLSTPWHVLRHLMGNRRAVIVYYGVVPDWQGKGLAPYMVDSVNRAALAAGYTSMGGTWIADENRASLRQMEKTGARRLQELHLFGKDL